MKAMKQTSAKQFIKAVQIRSRDGFCMYVRAAETHFQNGKGATKSLLLPSVRRVHGCFCCGGYRRRRPRPSS